MALIVRRMRLKLRVNGSEREVEARADESLLSVLRDDLGLTGARYGCGLGQCGACLVLLDGSAVPACQIAVGAVGARAVVTVEGLASGGRLHPLQEAFVAEDAMQCGYCTSGMLIAAAALLAKVPSPSEAEVREALAGNLCRCGVYGRALRAIERGANDIMNKVRS